eukprot:6185102-Pleurochrysis_carterae.AAC.1
MHTFTRSLVKLATSSARPRCQGRRLRPQTSLCIASSDAIFASILHAKSDHEHRQSSPTVSSVPVPLSASHGYSGVLRSRHLSSLPKSAETLTTVSSKTGIVRYLISFISCKLRLTSLLELRQKCALRLSRPARARSYRARNRCRELRRASREACPT